MAQPQPRCVNPTLSLPLKNVRNASKCRLFSWLPSSMSCGSFFTRFFRTAPRSFSYRSPLPFSGKSQPLSEPCPDPRTRTPLERPKLRRRDVKSPTRRIGCLFLERHWRAPPSCLHGLAHPHTDPDMRFNQAGGSGDRAVNQEKAEAERPVSETPHFSCPTQLTLSGGSC